MANEGFFHRLEGDGIRRIITGYDLWLSLLFSWTLYAFLGQNITEYKLEVFLNNATSFSGSLTAVIITGIAILVALIDTDFLVHLKKKGVYGNLMFTFEYSAMLSIFVSVFGILLQTYDFSFIAIYMFMFFFLYLVFAVSRLISQIVSFGDRKGDLAIVNELDPIVEQAKQTKLNNEQEADLEKESGE